MAKTIVQVLKQALQRVLLRRKGVKINHHCFVSGVEFDGTVVIEPYCRIIGDPVIKIGTNTYINSGAHLLGELRIGNDVMIGPKTVIWGRDHGMKKGVLIRKQPHNKSPIVIGDDVWIAANVTILKGVKIGYGAVIGAGAVVLRDIPPNAIAVGNPAKVIKYRE